MMIAAGSFFPRRRAHLRQPRRRGRGLVAGSPTFDSRLLETRLAISELSKSVHAIQYVVDSIWYTAYGILYVVSQVNTIA